MSVWFRRARGALGMAVVWGGAWGVLGGALMEGVIDPTGKYVDMWPQLLAMAGFVGGLLFSGVVGLVGLVAGRRPLDELSLAQFSGWGALAGVGLAAFVQGGPVAFLCLPLASAASAVATLGVARVASRRELRARLVAAGVLSAPRPDPADALGVEAREMPRVGERP